MIVRSVGEWLAAGGPARSATSTGPARFGTTPPTSWSAGPSTSTPNAARTSASKLGVDEGRLYPDYKALIAEEAKRKDGVEVVTIATPNFTHYEITKACLEAGLHVVCEKPLFFTVKECQEIEKLAGKKGLIVGVTYGFTGHPLVHQMAAMVKKGTLGDIRVVDLQYTHGFNSGDDAMRARGGQVAHQPEDIGPDLRARRYRHAHLLPVGNRPAAHEDRKAAVRPPVLHQVARPARGQRLCADALRQWRGRPSLGVVGQRRQHG